MLVSAKTLVVVILLSIFIAGMIALLGKKRFGYHKVIYAEWFFIAYYLMLMGVFRDSIELWMPFFVLGPFPMYFAYDRKLPRKRTVLFVNIGLLLVAGFCLLMRYQFVILIYIITLLWLSILIFVLMERRYIHT